MIDPSDICLESLPSVPLELRSQLPEVCCVYFAIDSHGAVQYVGQTVNAKRRWAQHHQHKALELKDGVKIAWLEIGDRQSLNPTEQALIKHFAPPLNGRWKRARACVNKAREKAISVRLPLFSRIYHTACAKFVQRCSLTKAVERSLVEWAHDKDAIEALARGVRLEAIAFGCSPRDVVKDFLARRGYGVGYDLEDLCDAVLIAWGLSSNTNS